jgi:hypothetical protein
MRFWLYIQRQRDQRTTLHRDGCALMRQVRWDNRWTGPLTWDEIALLPDDSYFVCGRCKPGCAPYRQTSPLRLPGAIRQRSPASPPSNKEKGGALAPRPPRLDDQRVG